MVQKIKENIVLYIIGLILVGITTWIGIRFEMTWNLASEEIPKVWTNVKSTQELIDQIMKDNCKIKQKMHDDSIRWATIQKIKHKP
jgi:hypothetical protein